MTNETTDNLETGSEIGHYSILRKIGKGGMGEVFLADDMRLKRKVALKVLPENIVSDRVRLLRFEREALAASALNHPNILTIYEFGNDTGVHFLAAEFIEGKTLREIIQAGTISLDDALKITIQIVSALQIAHNSGIIHRDIKPENIMVRADGLVKVLDFGLAKIVEDLPTISQTTYSEDDHTHLQTQAGMLMGTAAYMSPEQARGEEVDSGTDIFSFGIVLYELLTNRQPFTGETISHLLVSILDHSPKPIFTNLQIPAELERITLRALEKNKLHRYRTAAELLNDLKTLNKRLEFEAEFKRTSPANKATRIYPVHAAEAKEGNTVAVLPFINMSSNQDSDYFSDGLAEELINVLFKIRGLRVAARTSAFSFKGKQTTISEIGRALNVASVVEGSVRIAGNRVRISVQLVKTADGYHLWSNTYDRLMDDIFAVQDDIARRVVEELREMLLGKELTAFASKQIGTEVAVAVRGRADNAEAQRLMLLGRYFLDRTTREDTSKAIYYFRQALDLDAEYALCQAELGRAYSIEAGRGWVPVEKGFASSREATIRALQLEPNLAEGYAQLGRIQIAYDRDFQGAEISYQKALHLAPGSSSVLDGSALLAYKLGKFDKALESGRQVLIQDPLSAAFWHNLGLICHAADKFSEAEKAFRRGLEISPQRFVTHALLALVLLDAERAEEALSEAQLEPDYFWRIWSLAIIHHVAGHKSESDEIMQKLLDESAGNSYQIAEVYSMRGESDKAFQWLDQAYSERDAGMTHAKVNPRFRSLHSDSRWKKMLKKIGFDP